MAGRSGRRRVDPSSPLVDLDVVFADDEWLDGIATRPWMSPTDAVEWSVRRIDSAPNGCPPSTPRRTLLTGDPLTELFENWRDELALAPLPEPPRLGDLGRDRRAAEASGQALTARPHWRSPPRSRPCWSGRRRSARRTRRPTARSGPSPTVFWPNRVASVESADRANRELDLAQVALVEGRSEEAKLALFRATEALGGVEDLDGRDGIKQQVATSVVDRRCLPSNNLPLSPRRRTTDRSQLPTVASPTAAGSSAAAVAQSSIAAPMIVAARARGRCGRCRSRHSRRKRRDSGR